MLAEGAAEKGFYQSPVLIKVFPQRRPCRESLWGVSQTRVQLVRDNRERGNATGSVSSTIEGCISGGIKHFFVGDGTLFFPFESSKKLAGSSTPIGLGGRMVWYCVHPEGNSMVDSLLVPLVRLFVYTEREGIRYQMYVSKGWPLQTLILIEGVSLA